MIGQGIKRTKHLDAWVLGIISPTKMKPPLGQGPNHFTFYTSHRVLYIVNTQLIVISDSDKPLCQSITSPFCFVTSDPWRVEWQSHIVSHFPLTVFQDKSRGIKVSYTKQVSARETEYSKIKSYLSPAKRNIFV